MSSFTTRGEELEALIKDDELCNVYEEYIAKIHAWENFGFWFEVENYKAEPDPATRKNLARLIFQKFLASDAIFELGDVEPEMREIMESCLANPPVNMFDLMQRKAFDTLAQSTFIPFTNDKLHTHYKSLKEGKG